MECKLCLEATSPPRAHVPIFAKHLCCVVDSTRAWHTRAVRVSFEFTPQWILAAAAAWMQSAFLCGCGSGWANRGIGIIPPLYLHSTHAHTLFSVWSRLEPISYLHVCSHVFGTFFFLKVQFLRLCTGNLKC